ncbi:hypothetical protein KIN20_033895 [Parelaphostrongylus tenuis]|nr:hypothetical protein KIN20_033895 [Parelaphostrongylus tenuis]
MDVSSVEDSGESRDGFIYMTGIRCDNSGHLLLADAKTHTLKLFTSYGQLLKCARFACGASFPYCSSFAVSSFGFLMACDLLNNRMILYRFQEYKHGVRNELRCVQGRL